MVRVALGGAPPANSLRVIHGPRGVRPGHLLLSRMFGGCYRPPDAVPVSAHVVSTCSAAYETSKDYQGGGQGRAGQALERCAKRVVNPSQGSDGSGWESRSAYNGRGEPLHQDNADHYGLGELGET